MSVRRLFTLGGSEAAAACGVDPYLSPVMLWAYKTGRADRPETEAMHFGRKLERLVWEELEERGFDLLPAPADGFRDAEHKWLVGHPDGFCERPASDPNGSKGGSQRLGETDEGHGLSPNKLAAVPHIDVLEIKTANQWAHRAGWNGDVPVQYQAQAQVYMHLTARARCLVAVLVGGSRLEVRELAYDAHAIGLLLEGMERFHWHLRRDKMPAPDGSDSTRDALVHHLFPEAEPSKLVRLDREHWQYVRELRARNEQADTVKAQIQELENRLKAFMGDAELAISPHDTDAASWKNRQARRLDQTRLKTERPEVHEEFTTVKTERVFKLL